MAKGARRRSRPRTGTRSRPRTGTAWIHQVFQAGQVAQGNLIRRSMHSVARQTSPQLLEREVRQRGFHMALIGTQYVILCDPDGQMLIIC
jgi:hypothetical protein